MSKTNEEKLIYLFIQYYSIMTIKLPKTTYFVSAPELREYTFGKETIDILVTPQVFPLSPHGTQFFQNVVINPRECVIDVGTGTGVFAIAAAKRGAIVDATDISEAAVLLTRENAARNTVSIDCRTGSYFANFERKYDVIIANLPQEIVPPSYRVVIGADLTATMDGGNKGNEILLRFLACAPQYMHEHSRLYVVAYSVADCLGTMKYMTLHYNARLLAVETAPPKEFVEDNLDFFRELNRKGQVHIFEEDDTLMATVYTFELRLKRF